MGTPPTHSLMCGSTYTHCSCSIHVDPFLISGSPVEQCLFVEVGPSGSEILSVRAKLAVKKVESLQIVVNAGVEFCEGERGRERKGRDDEYASNHIS